MVWIFHCLFNYSSNEGYFGYFQFLATMANTVINYIDRFLYGHKFS